MQSSTTPARPGTQHHHCLIITITLLDQVLTFSKGAYINIDHISSTGILSFDTADMLDWMILCCGWQGRGGGFPVHRRKFNSIPGLYLLYLIASLPHTPLPTAESIKNKNVVRDCQMSPGRQNLHSWFKTKKRSQLYWLHICGDLPLQAGLEWGK